MLARGYAQRSWYLTSVQAGFEPWIGGTGLAVNSFSYTTNGTPPPTTSTQPPPSTSTPPPGGSGCTATYSTTGTWSGGYQAAITVRASGAIRGWRLTFPLASGTTITNLWGGRGSTSGSTETVTNETWNGTLAAGQTATVGFVANGTPSNPSITCTAT
jgi:cellulase/cellobiase CelA1